MEDCQTYYSSQFARVSVERSYSSNATLANSEVVLKATCLHAFNVCGIARVFFVFNVKLEMPQSRLAST